MAYTYFSKKQTNKGNTTSTKRTRKMPLHTLKPIPFCQQFRGGMGFRMCSGISLVSLLFYKYVGAIPKSGLNF